MTDQCPRCQCPDFRWQEGWDMASLKHVAERPLEAVAGKSNLFVATCRVGQIAGLVKEGL